jgi:beta-lactamase class A
VRSLAVGKLVPIRAAQALWMQSIEKILVALLFAEKISNGESHHIGCLKG